MSLYPILSSGITFLSYIPPVLRCIGHEPFHRSGNRMCATEPRAYFRHLSFWQDEVVTYLDRMLRDPLWVGSNEPFLGSGNAAGRWYRT